MKTWHYACLWGVCGALLGCRTDPNIPLLERDLRQKEDAIYSLQDNLEDHHRALEACRRENAALRQKLGMPPGGAAGPAEAAPRWSSDAPPPGAMSPEPPAVELPGTGSPQMPGSLRQRSAPPGESAPGESPRPLKPSAMESFRGNPGPAAAGQLEPILRVDSGQVRKISLNPILTGAFDADGMPWDKGLTVLVEAHNAQGKPVCSTAPISVVVLDAALPGNAARVARWEFSAEEVNHLFRITPVAQGIYLQVLWPVGPPKHSPLDVFVRFTTRDGRRLEAHQQIAMDLVARPPKQWSAAAPAGGASRPEIAPPVEGPSLGNWQMVPAAAKPAPVQTVEEIPAPAPVAEQPPAKKSPALAERPVWSPYR
jgi:hypothetical protein